MSDPIWLTAATLTPLT